MQREIRVFGQRKAELDLDKLSQAVLRTKTMRKAAAKKSRQRPAPKKESAA